MSYILDALKKSDKQRQQEHVPDLNTVQIESPAVKSNKASWHVPLAVVVLLNVMVILFFVLREEQPVPETPSVAHNTDLSQDEIIVQTEPELLSVKQEPNPVELVDTVDRNIVERQDDEYSPPPQELTPETTLAASGVNSPASQGSPQENVPLALQTEPHAEVHSQVMAEYHNVTTEPEVTETALPVEQQVDNLQQNQRQQTLPAASEAPTSVEPKASLVKKALHIYQLPEPLRQELPDIHIDAHLFYKDKPASRFASINGQIVREGDTFASNLKVAEISSNGVVFSYKTYLFYVSVF